MNRIHALLLLVFITAPLMLAGCAQTRIRHLSADAFIDRAEQIEQIASASWMTYVGCSETRAYLEYGDVIWFGPKPRTIVFWTELEDLPLDLAEQLKNGCPPWTPWFEKTKPEDNISVEPNDAGAP